MNPNIADMLGCCQLHRAKYKPGRNIDLAKFLADLDWWFTLKGISAVEEAQTELIKGYVGERPSDQGDMLWCRDSQPF